MATIESGTEARQGSKGRPALWVLVVSMILMVAAVAIALTWQGANSPKEPATQTSVPTSKEPSGSSAGGVPAANPVNPAPATQKAQ